MASEVWYRKWRPRAFAEVAGQEHVVRTLTNAVAQGRVAHAYLLCGPRGTGKTTTARVLAKAVNCLSAVDGEPCNRCDSCISVDEGRSLDLVEMDAASNRGIDDIRGLRDRVGYHPAVGRYRVYLIDEVHELTAPAFDALLKTLEEPPAHVIFVLATTDAHRVPATIISRCQRFDLARIRHDDLVGRLRFIAAQEGVAVEDGALDVIARAASGGLRDGVNLLEQLVATYGQAITEYEARSGLGLVADERARELAELAARGRFAEGLALIAAVRDDGIEMRQFNREVVAHLRALMLAAAGADAGLDGIGAEAAAALRDVASGLDQRRVLRALKAFAQVDFRGDAPPSLPLELALAEVALMPDAAPPEHDAAVPRQVARGRAAVRDLPPGPERTPAEPVARGVVTALGSERPPASTEAVRDAEPAVAPAATAAGPSATAVPDDEAPTVEQLRARFREIFDAVKVLHVPTGGILNSGSDIVAVDARSVTFGFRHSWMADRLLPGTQGHRFLTTAVRQVTGRELDVQCTHWPDVTDRLRALPPRPSHLLDEARRLGLEIIEG